MMIAAFYADSPELLVAHVAERLAEMPADPERATIALCAVLPCGGSASYPTVNDIPRHDVPCPCGDPTHWLIKYRGHS